MPTSVMRTLSFQATEEHHAIVHRAAQAKGISVSDYMRQIVIPWACEDLGETVADLSCYEGDLVAQAARKLGMSPRTFAEQAAREHATRILNLPAAEGIQDRIRDRLHKDSGIRAAAGGKRR